MTYFIILMLSLIICNTTFYFFYSRNKKYHFQINKNKQAKEEYGKICNLISLKNNELAEDENKIKEFLIQRDYLQQEIELLKQNEELQKEQIKNSLVKAQEDYQEKKDQLENEQIEQSKELQSLKATILSMTAAIKREQNEKLRQEKYRVLLSPKALKEIKVIQSVEDKLSDPRPLRMVIWTGYCSKPAKEMCVRVLGKNSVTGIYKITNLLTGLCYIGQAIDVKKRWSEHIKCGLGIDTPSGNKLYAAMQQDGIENFSFELLEACPQEELNKKEKFYIEVYDSYNIGYNSNKGVNK